ncbi:hypothetical protein O4H61_03330 [Roseovarius aestuarii]|nr:hypothetical protein [Roseovarius aestuarii]
MTQKMIALSAAVGVLASIDPDAYSAGTYTSGWVDMANWQEVMAVVSVGTMASGSTVDAKIEQATDASGTGAKDVTGALITQLTEAGTDSDKQAVISMWAEDLDADNDFTHARLSITVASAASDAGGIVLGASPRFGPVADHDAASVSEIVIVDVN